MCTEYPQVELFTDKKDQSDNCRADLVIRSKMEQWASSTIGHTTWQPLIRSFTTFTVVHHFYTSFTFVLKLG